MKSQGSSSRLKPFILFLLLIIVLPAILYSGYEINSLSTSEALIADIYRRQLAGASTQQTLAGGPLKPRLGVSSGPGRTTGQT